MRDYWRFYWALNWTGGDIGNPSSLAGIACVETEEESVKAGSDMEDNNPGSLSTNGKAYFLLNTTANDDKAMRFTWIQLICSILTTGFMQPGNPTELVDFIAMESPRSDGYNSDVEIPGHERESVVQEANRKLGTSFTRQNQLFEVARQAIDSRNRLEGFVEDNADVFTDGTDLTAEDLIDLIESGGL